MENNVPTETELLEGARRYDRPTLARIYDLYSPGLYRYALRLLNDVDLAEDCVAETFERFLHALRARRGPHQYLQAYLYRTAHNLVVDRYRKKSRADLELDENMLSQDPGPDASFKQHDQQDRLRVAIGSLTPDQQQVIVLKFIEGWEIDTIAAALGKPAGAVKSLQHRALARLQRFLIKDEVIE